MALRFLLLNCFDAIPYPLARALEEVNARNKPVNSAVFRHFRETAKSSSLVRAPRDSRAFLYRRGNQGGTIRNRYTGKEHRQITCGREEKST